MFTEVVPLKEDMLSKSLVGVLLVPKTIGLLLTHGDQTGVYQDISGWE